MKTIVTAAPLLHRVMSANAPAVNARRVPRRAGNTGCAGHRARHSLAGAAGLIATQLNITGCCMSVWPVVRAAHLVSTPLARPAGACNPRYVLRPLRPARVARRSLRVAPSHTPDIHWPACPCLRHRHRCSGQALRAVRGVGPAHPLGPGAYAPLARAGQGPSAPKGLPPARRCAVVALRGGGRHRACSSAVMHGSLRLAWPTPSLL
jgi:hypothetical protein